MAKIPFDIKYRPQIESGEYKVKTRDEEPVEIVLWDWCGGFPYPILGRVGNNGDPFIWTRFGRLNLGNDPKEDTKYDLFITTEPELSEFEKKCIFLYKESYSSGKAGLIPISDGILKECASALLELARKQLIEEQYTSDPRKTNLYKLGKAEALKDLPRWRTWENGACGNSDGHPIALVAGCGGIRFVSCLGTTGEKYIFLSDLKKLPGFKED